MKDPMKSISFVPKTIPGVGLVIQGWVIQGWGVYTGMGYVIHGGGVGWVMQGWGG